MCGARAGLRGLGLNLDAHYEKKERKREPLERTAPLKGCALLFHPGGGGGREIENVMRLRAREGENPSRDASQAPPLFYYLPSRISARNERRRISNFTVKKMQVRK